MPPIALSTRVALPPIVLACLISAVAFAQEARMRDLTLVTPGEPQLAINAGGHTAAVKALAFTPDSGRLMSAGLDKGVRVWNLDVVTRDLLGSFLRERVIRWQVGRGLRGSIFALATAPSDGLLAIGGYGASGGLGEILLVDPVDGRLKKTLLGHRQTVASLSFSTDGNWLASTDTDGRSLLRKLPDWKPITLYESDEKTYGADPAQLIAGQPKLRPIVIAGSSRAVVPVFVGKERDGRLRWRLQEVNLADPTDHRTHDTFHYGMVTALAADPGGWRLASADLEGNLYLWDVGLGAKVRRLAAGQVVLSLAFSPDGKTLAVGTEFGDSQPGSELQLWNVDTATIRRSRRLADHVTACAISPDGKTLAYNGGLDRQVFVEPLDAPERVASLQGRARPVWKVAFAQQEPFYHVALGTTSSARAFNDYAELEETFDPQKLQTGDDVDPDQSAWLPSDWLSGGWTAQTVDDRLQLYRAGRPRGSVVLDVNLDEGSPRSYCWIPDADGKPLAVAVGTDRQNSIYVCRLADNGACPVLRHFRGHHDWVTSLAVSRDLRYLVSGSVDGTVKFWSLAAAGQETSNYTRWGAALRVDGDRLVVDEIHKAGPLFGKGVRKGDVLEEIRWYDDNSDSAPRVEKRASAIAQNLLAIPWGTQVQFEYSRGDVPRPGFLLLPAWRPLATLLTSSDGHWAFWTPQGYYDASVGGHTLFGWLVNRGLDSLPDFYRADHFHEKLEQPGVMGRLLEAGSLHEALRLSELEPEGELDKTHSDQIALAPTVRIIQPRPDALVRENVAKVRAVINVPSGSELARAKAYANGVVAAAERIVEQQDGDRGREITYEWDVPLPTDRRNVIQVFAGTDTRVRGLDEVLIRSESQSSRRPRMYVLAVGVDDYPGRPLGSSTNDAAAVRDIFQQQAAGLYDVAAAVLLTDVQVTRRKWRATLEEFRGKLDVDVEPDDLVVFFFAGHGVEDQRTKQYHFVAHGVPIPKVIEGVYDGCISWSDFDLLENVPCRKLVILDTCHSGAIQPLHSRHQKAAVRGLQDGVIFTLTATTADQGAMEVGGAEHGLFTSHLLAALRGEADRSEDGVVTLKETAVSLKKSVPEAAREILARYPQPGQTTQQPTAAPEELLRLSTMGLTRVRRPDKNKSTIVPTQP